jgi:hypothetical protein
LASPRVPPNAGSGTTAHHLQREGLCSSVGPAAPLRSRDVLRYPLGVAP